MYYLSSRYYDPNTRRFINADDTEVWSEDQDEINQYDLFAYCLDNPVNMVDEDGYNAVVLRNKVGSIAVLGAMALVVLKTVGCVSLSTIGFVSGGVIVVLVGSAVGYVVYKKVKSKTEKKKYDPNPYGRKNQKK